MSFDPERIGIDPFGSPLSVLHVIDPRDPGERDRAGRLVQAHTERGWRSRMVGVIGVGDADSFDVVVLYGQAASRHRRYLRGATTTVVLAAPGSPRWRDVLVERALARWTNAVVVPDAATAERWARLVAVPLVSAGTDPEEFGAVLVRARTLGGGAPVSG